MPEEADFDVETTHGIDEEENYRECQDDETPIPLETIYFRKKALLELKCKVENAILSKSILGEDQKAKENRKAQENLKELTLWGVPLLPSKGHEATDVILLKFLKARDFKASEAFNMLQNTLKWRKKSKVDKILEEDFGIDLENAGYIGSKDKKGHPLCYIVHRISNWKDIYKERFGTLEKCEVFLSWNLKFMEKCIQHIDFKPGGANSIIRIVDLKHAPASAMKEVRFFFRRLLALFRENYPGIIFKYVFINVPLWILAYHSLQLRLLSQKTKNKFKFVRPYRVTKTLLKSIAPESLPVQYGGLEREEVDEEFSCHDKVEQIKVRANATESINIPVHQVGVTVYWDMTVVGQEVSYKEEFIPEDDCSYTILVQKEKKMKTSVRRNSFHIREPGHILLTFDNPTFKKKKVFYRYSIKPTLTNLTFST